MHSPMVVAFEIRRPWPKVRKTKHNRREIFSTSPFWYFKGWELYSPGVITVWHIEPGGADSGTVCKHGKGSRWQWHVHHWKVQVRPLQRLRRAALTRCEECGRKGSPNHSFQWDRASQPWWRGEKGLYHDSCSALVSLRRTMETDRRLIEFLFDRYCTISGYTAEVGLSSLIDFPWDSLDFPEGYRLYQMLGYKRVEDGMEFVKIVPEEESDVF